MDEKNAYKILLQLLEGRGLHYATESENRNLLIPGNHSTFNRKIIVAEIGNLLFVAYDAFGNQAGSSETFSGVYFTVSQTDKQDCSIYAKSTLDFFFRRNKIKSGNPEIDSKLTICSSSHYVPLKLLNYSAIESFLKLKKAGIPSRMLLIAGYLPMISAFNGKTVAGVEANEWIFEENKLDLLLQCAMQMQKAK